MKKALLILFVSAFLETNAQWVAQASGTVDFLSAVFFPSTNVGYMTANGYLLKTTNGGANWNPLPGSGMGGPLFFTSIDTGYTNSSAGILKTVDGGLTWVDNFPFSTVDNCNIHFPTKSIGYVVTQNITFDSVHTYKTVNAGASWALTNSFPTLLGILSSIYFSDVMTGSMVLQSSGIYKTSDGGITWIPKLATLSAENLSALHFPTASVGYAVGGDSIFKTIDIGETWNSIYPPSSFPYNSVYFTDLDTGYACGGDGFSTGVIRKTVDGGLSWTLSNTNPYTFQSIHFPDASTGFACGQSGVIYKYSTITGISDSEEVNGVSVFPNPNNGNMLLNYYIKQDDKGFLKIYDGTGKLVNETILNSNNDKVQINTNLDQGIYFYQVIVNDRVAKSDKIVIIQ